MSRSATFLVVSFMVMISGCAGIIVYMQLQLRMLDGGLVACVVFSALALGQIIFERARERKWIERRVHEVAAVASDASEEAARTASRITALEGDLPTRIKAEVDPLTTEVEVIGSLLRQIAEAVAEVDDKVERQRKVIPVVPSPAPAAVADPQPAGSRGAAGRAGAAYQGQYQGAAPGSRPVRPAGADARPAAGGRAPRGETTFEREVAEAIRAERIEVFLQPIVSLPQRKVRFYELQAGLRARDGELVSIDAWGPVAEAIGQMPRLDSFVVLKAIQIIRRLTQRNRDVGLFVGLSTASLVDVAFVRELLNFMQANRDIAEMIVFEFRQAAFEEIGAIELETLHALRDSGCRFSIGQASEAAMNLAEQARNGVRYVKVPAEKLLRHEPLAGDIHPQDVSTLLARFGIELIVEDFEREAQVVDLLDYDIRFGQGNLFSVPRPVRPEVFAARGQDAAPARPVSQPSGQTSSGQVSGRSQTVAANLASGLRQLAGRAAAPAQPAPARSAPPLSATRAAPSPAPDASPRARLAAQATAIHPIR